MRTFEQVVNLWNEVRLSLMQFDQEPEDAPMSEQITVGTNNTSRHEPTTKGG